MKAISTLFLSLVIVLTINANPISLPTIEISELYFDESDNWKLELGYYGINQSRFPIDSIFICSTSDMIKLHLGEFIGTSGVFVITADSLETDFHINRYADTIKVISYIMEQPFEDELIFGNFSGAAINYPRQGQSISKYWRFFVKDNSPSIGFSNDTIGICGTLKGIMYDKYNGMVNNRSFYIDNLVFETSSNGEYSARVFSKKISVFNYIIYQWCSQGIVFGKSAPITEISYVMEPDSVIELDIHLQETLATGINDKLIVNTPIQFYPNPVSKNEKINISIDLPTITSDIWLEIISLNGKVIKKERISQNSSSVIAPTQSGIYIIRVMLDSEIISSNRIIVNE